MVIPFNQITIMSPLKVVNRRVGLGFGGGGGGSRRRRAAAAAAAVSSDGRFPMIFGNITEVQVCRDRE